MDKNGKCFPTQDQIANYLGMTRQAANQRVTELLKFRMNGKPVVTLIGDRHNNVYRIEAISQLSIFDKEVEVLEVELAQGGFNEDKGELNNTKALLYNIESTCCTNYIDKQLKINNKDNDTSLNDNKESSIFSNGKEIIKYFISKYREAYGVNYSPNWGRDVGLVKKKLLDVYPPEQIKGIIDVVFEEYDGRWAKEKYPRPSLGSLTTWLPNEALAILDVKRKEKERLQAAMDAQEPDMEKIIEFLEGRAKKIRFPK